MFRDVVEACGFSKRVRLIEIPKVGIQVREIGKLLPRCIAIVAQIGTDFP